EHPKPAAFIPGHGDGIDDFRFASEKADFKSCLQGELFLCVLRRKSRRRGRGMLASELFARRFVPIYWKIKAPRPARNIIRTQAKLRHEQRERERKESRHFHKEPA